MSPQPIHLNGTGLSMVWIICVLGLIPLLGNWYMGSRPGWTPDALEQAMLRMARFHDGWQTDPTSSMLRILLFVSMVLGAGLMSGVSYVLAHPALWLPAAAILVAGIWLLTVLIAKRRRLRALGPGRERD